MSRLSQTLVAVCLLAVAGCRVSTHKNGKNSDVDIGTPFGSVHVKTDENHAVTQTGLTPYPGATVVRKGDHDSGAADINLSFGGIKLGVHAVELQSPDAQDKVLAFYKTDMARYGQVLTCRGKEPIGTPVRTGEGLTCDSEQHGADDKDHGIELRAGSERRQHIVAVHDQDGGTRIGLVALDLPKSLRSHDANERE